MALDDVFNISRPNMNVGGTDPLELAIEEFSGEVAATISRRSKTEGWIPMKSVRGTTTIRSDGVGESTLQKLVPGATPDGIPSKQGKNTLTIDTVILAREVFPLLDVFQTHYDRRMYVAREHGKKIAKFLDQAMFIQAVKASLLANSTFYANATELPGHSGGSIETLALAGDALDPAKLYAAIANLLVKLENKDVDPQNDGLVIVTKPEQFYALLQAEQLINAEYITAMGNKVQGMVLKAYGVPVWSSNNYPAGLNITGNLLSNADNGNAYDGDFQKAVLTAFTPQSLMAGETIPLTTDVFYDKTTKGWFVDAHLAFGVTPDRAEFAASIYKP
jgi:hypothetical protein